MINAPKLDAIHQERGPVQAAVGDRYRVQLRSGRFEARLAASCLLVPMLGDEVVVAVDGVGPIFVLAVLTRQDPEAPARWRVDGDVCLEAAGRVDVVGGAGVAVRSPVDVELAAPEVAVTAVNGTLNADRWRFLARTLETHAETAKTVVRTLDQVADRLSQRLRRSYRFVEELDLTRADQIEHRARATMTLKGKNTFVAAEDLVKVDGEQIHLG